MSSFRPRAWLIVASVIALTGCTSGVDAAAPSPNPSQAAEIATLDIPGVTGSDMAAHEGVLTIVDGCLALDTGTVPVFGSGEAQWDGETLVWGGEEFRIGDKVQLGGSPVSDEYDPVIPAGCADMEPWGVGGMKHLD